ncbi:hypothetical protein GCM10007907_00120 [Chitinimonas prasina]|uniref:Uncharacterized protein n=2 Tax=Chitinimonas prasina TaxID=1434937 RepID=A0ABQ5Y8G2_9NEIS|nr:hypothetical protein GCM10007907_00120 [Chitinimonas prasina]
MCGYQTIGYVKQIAKGKIKVREIGFGISGGFEVGKNYKVFLKKSEDLVSFERLVRRHFKKELDAKNFLENCQGVISGYYAFDIFPLNSKWKIGAEPKQQD